jgi:hypothetical protein
MAEQRKPKKIVEQITEDKAAEILGDVAFVKGRRLNRVFHVVRDPRDPSNILSVTVMENIPFGAEVINPGPG